MINLQKTSGLPIQLQDDFHLKFNPPLKQVVPAIRRFSEVLPVLMDQNAKPMPASKEMYYMYRNVHLPGHDFLVKNMQLTYDITVIPPIMLGQEFNKTVGHYHQTKPGTSIGYPEIYEVLHGQALFLIQKMDSEFKELISVYAIVASTGQKIIYPPNYGHILVNIGSDALVTSNWVGEHFERMYKPVSRLRGMAYYVVKDEKDHFKFEPNPVYSSHPEVRVLMDMRTKVEHEFGFKDAEPMYVTGTKYPIRLDFLNNPEKYPIELSTLTS